MKFIVLLFLSACVQKPTKVYESKDPEKLARPAQLEPELERPDLSAPLKITKNTIVLDARKPFNYSLAHIRGSRNLRWTDFAQRKKPFQGVLVDDLFFHSRRLARLGLTPESDVLVVGQGLAGSGEEGRLAWTLYYMGVKNVRYASIDMFRYGWTNHVTEKPKQGATVWKPARQESIWLKKKEMMKLLTGSEGGYFKSRLRAPKNKDVVLLDVRSVREFKATDVDLRAMHIHWKEFFNQNGRPRREMARKLRDVGVTSSKRIVVLSDKGVRSGAVTMALIDLGFLRATNFAGGYQQLLSQ